MCGLAGELRFDDRDAEASTIESMIDTIVHRGPDAGGVHLDGPVGLGHRRLSIVDLSTGDQPFPDETGTIWCVFNGEIYNHERTRVALEAKGHSFRSTSDTEVIVALYREYGDDFVDHLTGMFAIAIWDATERRLVLARDHIGIKPLYFAATDDSLIFASEVKALLAGNAPPAPTHAAAIDRFLTHYFVPGDITLHEGIQKLAPGSILVADADGWRTSRFWRLGVGREVRDTTMDRATDELDELLEEVVHDHLMADVPLGFLLSGGLDSSLMVALAAPHLDHRPQTFTVGFDSPDVTDERPYARLVADQFGCEHRDISLLPENFWDFLPTYVRHMEEPVCEAPAVALAAVSDLASDHVKVVLSGEGGDEAFAGYLSYRRQLRFESLSRRLGPVGRAIGPQLARLAERIGRHREAPFLHDLGSGLEERYHSRTAGPYQYVVRHRDELYRPEIRGRIHDEFAFAVEREALAHARGTSVLSRMLQVDSETWLPDDLLVKADKMTMLHSIELRVPLLDHRVLEFAAALPDELKLQGDEAKRVLRNVARKRLPAAIIDRPKAGFPVPYENWLRTSLRYDVDELLLSEDSNVRDFLRVDGIADVLREDRAGERLGKEVFCLVVLELWLREFGRDRVLAS